MNTNPARWLALASLFLAGLAAPAHAEPIIKLPADTFVIGQPIEVTVSGLPGNQQDWLTVVEASATEDSFGKWSYTGGVAEGTWTFRVPRPGDYEVRVYFDFPAGGYTVQARKALQIVAQAAPAPVKPEPAPAPPVAVPQAESKGIPFGTRNFVSTMTGLLRGPATAADNTLKQMGYQRIDARNNCAYQLDSGATRRDLIEATDKPDCTSADAVVSRIEATETLRDQLIPVKPEIQSLKDELQAPPKCTQLTDSGARCTWQYPPKLTTLKKFTVNLSSNDTPNSTVYRKYWLFPKTGVDDLREARQIDPNVVDPPDPFANEQDAKHQAAMPQDAVTAAEIQQEADLVLEFCKTQTTYAAHNDCACIREQFIAERQKNPASGIDPIQVATKIPETRCPNPKGVRDFYYAQCGRTYANKIQAGLEAFCACYADEIRDQYVAQPRGGHSGMTRYMGAAMSICDQRGLPSPLHPDRQPPGPAPAEPSMEADERGFIPLPEGFCRPAGRSPTQVQAYRSCQAAKDPDSWQRKGFKVNVDWHHCVYSGITLAGDQANEGQIKQDCEAEYGPYWITLGD